MLRNICAIIMLGGLIFTGIRILLSANIPTKKTQYLMLLQDWLMGMALLLFSHIIMILIFELSDALVSALSKATVGSIKWEIIKQMGGSFDSTTQVIALTMYHWINWLVIVFAIAYFKRFFWTCILTIFAPIFCVMYAFGQQTKQIYTNWLKEYIMNALVQPFHLIVYTVLITFPMEIANGGNWTWSWNNGTEMIYALMAMTMIRPSEKYLRKLFNMDKGIANMASYDSGMKTIKDIGKAVATVAKAAIAVYTGGASAMASGALGSAAGSAAGKMLGKVGGDALSKAGTDAMADLGSGVTDAKGGLEELGGAGKETPQWLSEDWDRDSQGRYFNPYNEEWMTEGELNAGNESFDSFDAGDAQTLNQGFSEAVDQLGENIDGDKFNEGKELADRWGKGELDENNISEEEYAKMMYYDENKNKVGSENSEEEQQELPEGEKEGEEKQAVTEGATKGEEKGNAINASTVTINAGNVQMGTKAGNNEEIKTIEAANVETDNVENDGNNEIVEGDGIALNMPETETDIDVGEVFKNLGGLEKLGELGVDIFDGLGSIGDGLYVDGTAPTAERNADVQWLRGNIKEAGAEREKKLKQEKDSWANNKSNISIMTEKYMNDKNFRDSYSDKPEAYVRRKAEEKAKSALKDMSEYVPYGVTDVNLAYELYQNANNNGFSPEQSVKHMAGYANFNINAGNVSSINQSGAYERNDYTNVQAAIPDAKTYYDAGYTNINEMQWVDYMAQKLGKSPEFAMKVDEALKKKGKGGKLSYNGKDAAMKQVIDQINSHYGG